MTHPRALDTPDLPEHWRVFRSDTGRFWASRTARFTVVQEQAGAARTVDGDDELALARAIAEQESRATLAEVVPDAIDEQIQRQIDILEQAYPAWRITRLKHANGVPAGWTATRHAPLTHSQRVAGLLPQLTADDADALVTALSVQTELAHASRARAGGMGR